MARTEALPGLRKFLADHDLTQRALAAGAGLHEGNVSYILSGRHLPKMATVERILGFARRYDPKVTFEDLFAEELPEQAPDTPEVASAAAGGNRHA